MNLVKLRLYFLTTVLSLLFESGLQAQDQTPDTQAPSVPLGLAATAITANSIALTWTASVDDVGVTEYRIYRRVSVIVGGRGGGTRIKWNLVQQGITDATVTLGGLASGVAYTLAVTALDAAGNESARSGSILARTLPPPPPPPPSEVPPAPGTPYAITEEPFLYFLGQPNDSESSTSLVSAPDGAVFDGATGFILWTPSIDQVGLAAFVIRLVADEGTFDQHLSFPVYPSGSDVLPPSLLPEAPAATGITREGCTLTWLASADPGAAGYKIIARKEGAGTTPFIAADTGDPLTGIVVSQLEPGTDYRLWVAEYDEFGQVPPDGASPSVLIHTLPLSPPAQFIRGDPNGDGTLNLADVVLVLYYLLGRAGEPACLAAADVNSSGDVDLSDAIFLLWFVFDVEPSPGQPFPACGLDPSVESPGCALDPGCQ